jgi:hypothetical protein
LFWKSVISFLIFAWFSGLRASWTSFAATPDAMSFRIMPAMFASLLLTDFLGAQREALPTTGQETSAVNIGDRRDRR